MITPERATELMYESDQENSMYPNHKYQPETPAERAYIVSVWKKMNGRSCYYDALKRIASGKVK